MYSTPPHYIHLVPNLTLVDGNDHAVLAGRPGSNTAKTDQATPGALEESVSIRSAGQLAFNLAVAGVVGADSLLGLVAVGSGSDGAEEDLSGAIRSRCAERECRSAVAEDCIWGAGAGGG